MAFPGLFTYRDLLNLDGRDFAFWLAEAGRASARHDIRAVTAACAPHMDAAARVELLRRLNSAADTSDAAEARYAAGRAALAAMIPRKTTR